MQRRFTARSRNDQRKSWRVPPRRLAVVAGCLLACLCFEVIANAAELDRSLAKIGLKLISQSPDLNALETEYLKLLEMYKLPEEQGKIYYALAHMYAQHGEQYTPKVAEYCERALKFPLEPIEAIRMYVYWGDALWTKYRDAPAEEFVGARLQIASLYLNGFKLVLAHQRTNDAGSPPSVDGYLYLGPRSGPEYDEIVRKHDAQVKARQEWDQQHTVVWDHKVLVEHIVRIYAREPRNEAELRKLAQEILDNPTGLEEILKRYHNTVSANP